MVWPAASSRRSSTASRSARSDSSSSLNSGTLRRSSAVCMSPILACYSPRPGSFLMDDNKTVEAPLPELDERAIARKYGLRELTPPDSEQVKALTAFLAEAAASGRCGPIPKTAVVMTVEFFQATINRQHITKGPRMTQDEFDALQTPYYLAARVVSKIQRARYGESPKTSQLYQN